MKNTAISISEIISFCTAPWASPTNVSVTLLNTTTIDVSWRPIPDDKINCDITKYEVNLTLNETRCNDEILMNTSNVVHDVVARNTHVVLQRLSLRGCSVYGISVRGYTMAGPGPYSNTVNITTRGKKLPQTNVTQNCMTS